MADALFSFGADPVAQANLAALFGGLPWRELSMLLAPVLGTIVLRRRRR